MEKGSSNPFFFCLWVNNYRQDNSSKPKEVSSLSDCAMLVVPCSLCVCDVLLGGIVCWLKEKGGMGVWALRWKRQGDMVASFL